MKLRSRWILRLVGLLGAWLIRWWMSTVRCRVFFLDGVSHVIGQRKENCIYAFWHEAILYTIVSPSKRVTVLIGQHADGELVTQVCNFLGFTVVRGSSTRGGGSALLGLCRMSRMSNIAVTPDGPHGLRGGRFSPATDLSGIGLRSAHRRVGHRLLQGVPGAQLGSLCRAVAVDDRDLCRPPTHPRSAPRPQ